MASSQLLGKEGVKEAKARFAECSRAPIWVPTVGKKGWG